MSPRCLLLSLALATLFAPVASAATIRADDYDTCEEPDGCPLTVSYDAAPGETNTVSVSAEGPDGGYVVSDSTAPLTAGENCVQIDPSTARCSLPGGNPSTFVGVYVRLGDGDDSLTAADSAIGFGGPGADTLAGGPGRDVFIGGPGEDTLRGGGGRDVLDGDDGPTDAFDDLLDGGEGIDQVTYRDRKLPVTANLASSAAGSPGERDRLMAIEDLEGGLRANILIGDDGPNVLQAPSTSAPILGETTLLGGAGDDRLFGGPRYDAIAGGPGDDTVDGGISTQADDLSGGAGDDEITGSDGPDEISGGPGNDVIVPRLRHRLQRSGAPSDKISCGGGIDSVNHPYPRVLVGRTCEGVAVQHARLQRPRKLGPRLVEIAATFIKARSTLSPCAAYIELRHPQTAQLLGRSQRLRWRRSAEVTFHIRLTAAGVQRLSRGRPVLITARVNSLYSCRRPGGQMEGFTIRL